MLLDGPNCGLVLPANDNLCVVHRVNWRQENLLPWVRLDDPTWSSRAGSEIENRQQHLTTQDWPGGASPEVVSSGRGIESTSISASLERIGLRPANRTTAWEVAFGAVIIALGIAHLVEDNIALADAISSSRDAEKRDAGFSEQSDGSGLAEWGYFDASQNGDDSGTQSRTPNEPALVEVSADLELELAVEPGTAEMGPATEAYGPQTLVKASESDPFTEAIAAHSDPENAASSRDSISRTRIEGSDGDDHLIGTDGDDFILGGDGDDLLDGGGGNDILDGGHGADLMLGGSGDDIFAVDDAGDVIAEAEDQGTDTAVVVAPESFSFSLAGLEHVENLLAAGGDTFSGEGNANSNIIVSQADQSTLSGGEGDDVLITDTGNDTLDGGSGHDTMAGSIGNDTYVVDDSGDRVLEHADEGIDEVETTLAEYRLDEHVENLTYVGSEDFVGYGNSGANELRGGDGDDELFGDAFYYRGTDSTENSDQQEAIERVEASEQLADAALAELLGASSQVIQLAPAANADGGSLTGTDGASPDTVVVGSRKNDVLVGEHFGDDLISGGRGNDRIEGGGGNDTLTGGSDHDVFVFRAGFGRDVITDFGFDDGDLDTIVLARELFNDHDELLDHIEQVGSDVVIFVSQTDQITLQNFDKMNLSVNDQFVFV